MRKRVRWACPYPCCVRSPRLVRRSRFDRVRHSAQVGRLCLAGLWHPGVLQGCLGRVGMQPPLLVGRPMGQAHP